MSVISFTKVALPFGWLGNMSPHYVTFKHPALPDTVLESGTGIGVAWKSTEALFQALRFNDPAIITEIWRAKNGFAAKLVAKKYPDKMVIAPRSVDDLLNMIIVLSLKIETHPELKEQLLATGDAKIVEDSSSRRNDSGLFWGAALIDDEWVGKNILGKLWMYVRKEARTNKTVYIANGNKDYLPLKQKVKQELENIELPE